MAARTPSIHEDFNKCIKICASGWSLAKVILRCTVSETKKKHVKSFFQSGIWDMQEKLDLFLSAAFAISRIGNFMNQVKCQTADSQQEVGFSCSCTDHRGRF
jgi:hypothetical protein